LELIRIITNNNFAGIHELVKGNDSIWVASTSAGAAIEADPLTGKSKKEYWPGEEAVFHKRLKLKPVIVDKTIDNRLNFLKVKINKGSRHLHLNIVTPWKDNLYALFNRQESIVDLKLY
jgi:cyanophycinase-like exopeptidase